MNTLLIGFTFLTVALLVIGLYLAVMDLVARRSTAESAAAAAAAGVHGLTTAGPLTMPPTGSNTAASELGWQDRMRLWIEQSGTRIRPLVLIGLTVTVAVLSALTVRLLLQSWWAAVLALPITAVIPVALLVFARHQRTERLRAQLPDALDLMSRMLRAGQTIPQSLRGVADEFDAPIADEFGYCYEQQNLGLSTDASMYEMARRTGTLELRILVVALTVHRQSGGNLSELLDNLAQVIRDRHRIQGQIRALTADGRLQAAILLVLPPLLFGVLSLVNRDYVTILYQFPWLLLGMLGFELLGAIWLHRIVSFDF